MRGPRTLSAAIVLVAGVAVTGCQASGNEEVTLTFLNPHAGAYEPVAEAFEQAHPGVSIELQSVPFEQMVEQTQARLSSGDTSIDIVSVDPPRLANMVQQGFLTEETDHLPEMEANVSQAAISSVTVDDRQWAYPLWTSDNFLFYNRTLLEEAGFPVPGPTSADRLTWEEVVDMSRSLVDAGDAQYGIGMDQVDRYYALQPLLESMGAGPGLEGPDGLTPAVDTEEWERFGQWYGGLYADGLAPRGVDPAQMVDLFRAGHSAFLLGGASAIGRIADGDFPGEWGIAPHPYFADGPIVTPTDSWAIGVSATSEHQEIARDFVQFATLDPQGAQLASSVNTLPPVQHEAFDEYVGYIQELAPEQTAHFGELFQEDTEHYARHRPTSAGYVQFESEMNNAFSDIRNGADPRRVLGSAQEALERQLDRLRELAAEAEGNER